MFTGRNLTGWRYHRRVFWSKNHLFFMDHSLKKRVFSGRKNVSGNVQADSISLAAALVDQAQSENAAIAHGLKKQNPELLDHLIELYQHRLLRYLLFLTGKREVAEDLFQETWVRVLLRGAQYNGKARFDTDRKSVV